MSDIFDKHEFEEDSFDEDNELQFEKNNEAKDYENQEAIEFLLNDSTYSDDLTEWEVDFLNSIKEKRDLTEKQQMKLDQIWYEIMEEGLRN